RRKDFEADRWEIMIMDAQGGTPRSITPSFDGSAQDIIWSPTSDRLYFAAEEKAYTPIWEVTTNGGPVKQIYRGHTQSSLSISRAGEFLAFPKTALTHPAEVCVIHPKSVSTNETNISQANTKLLDELDFAQPESVTVPGAGGTPMQMWIIQPPGF